MATPLSILFAKLQKKGGTRRRGIQPRDAKHAPRREGAGCGEDSRQSEGKRTAMKEMGKEGKLTTKSLEEGGGSAGGKPIPSAHGGERKNEGDEAFHEFWIEANL